LSIYSLFRACFLWIRAALFGRFCLWKESETAAKIKPFAVLVHAAGGRCFFLRCGGGGGSVQGLSIRILRCILCCVFESGCLIAPLRRGQIGVPLRFIFFEEGL
jgi:hypothetical protein